MSLLGKPQVQPTIPTAPTVKNWAQMQQAFAGVYKLLSTLVLYLQTYLTKIYNAVVPSQLNPVTVTSAETPYAVAQTDEFIQAQAGNYLLPPATGSGRTIIFFNTGSGAVNIIPNGTDKLNGAGTISPGTQYQMTQLVDGKTGEWSYWTIV